jgi:transposase
MAILDQTQMECIMKKDNLNLSNVELARRLNVSEGSIRYHRKKEKKEDGRKSRFSCVSNFIKPIQNWVNENQSRDRQKRDTVLSLYDKLSAYHQFSLSYDALRRYIKKQYPDLIKKSYKIRVETPPGKLAQVDWKESVKVQVGNIGNWIVVNFLILILCFSRKPSIVVRKDRSQVSFLSAHHEAGCKLHGLPEYVRSDCMKTAVRMWHGRESEMNHDYQEFLNKIDVKSFPARPGTATDKGKVEKKIRDIFRNIPFDKMVFESLDHLQQYIDDLIEEKCKKWICPATGTTIEQAYAYERQYLNSQIRELPAIPVDSIQTTVKNGSLVYFRGNYYQIPEGYLGQSVRVINSGTKIEIYHQGECLDSYDYYPDIKGMVRLSKKAIQLNTRPLSELTRQWCLEVADRQIEHYQKITGGV